jgi:hypothetical protein
MLQQHSTNCFAARTIQENELYHLGTVYKHETALSGTEQSLNALSICWYFQLLKNPTYWLGP